MTVRLRLLRDDDIPALVDVFVSAFQIGYAELMPADVLSTVTRPAVTGWFAQWSTQLTTTVAERGDTPVGFVRYGDDEDDPNPGVGYIAALYVHPRAARGGIGRLLLQHALAELAGRGQPIARLWVFRDNERARDLYTSEGFVPDGIETTDPQWRVPQIRLRRDGASA